MYICFSLLRLNNFIPLRLFEHVFSLKVTLTNNNVTNRNYYPSRYPHMHSLSGLVVSIPWNL